MNRIQRYLLWLCIGLVGYAFLLISAQTMWGYLRLATEWSDKTVIPKDNVFAILNMEYDLFCWVTILNGAGLIILIYLAFSLKRSSAE